jgi:hypothetical protein
MIAGFSFYARLCAADQRREDAIRDKAEEVVCFYIKAIKRSIKMIKIKIIVIIK